MSVTMATVRAALDVDEPDYVEAAELGAAALPFLEKLVREADPMLASKAAYLASLIEGENAVNVVKAAAESPHAVVRVAAAAGARNLPAAGNEHVLKSLAKDADPGVRKAATRPSSAQRATATPARDGLAPPESGGGSFGTDASGDVASRAMAGAVGEGGGSATFGGDGPAHGSEGAGGGSVAGDIATVGVTGEGGGG